VPAKLSGKELFSKTASLFLLVISRSKSDWPDGSLQSWQKQVTSSGTILILEYNHWLGGFIFSGPLLQEKCKNTNSIPASINDSAPHSIVGGGAHVYLQRRFGESMEAHLARPVISRVLPVFTIEK
jgi:hypothetical protein